MFTFYKLFVCLCCCAASTQISVYAAGAEVIATSVVGMLLQTGVKPLTAQLTASRLHHQLNQHISI